VGTLQQAWTDASREETFTSEPGDRRALMVRLWYPARTRPQAQPAPYFLTWREGALLASSQRLPPQLFGFFFPHAVLNAPLPEGTERFPVLLLSPGHGTSTALYSGAAEELASHGYVVVAISHTYSSGPVVFPDGRVAEHTVHLSPTDPDLTTRVQDVWTADARFVLGELEKLDTTGRFAGRLDLGRTGMLGHSFGGSTAGEVCRTDARVRAGVNMDGTFFGALGSDVHVPFLVMNSDGTEADRSRARFFEHLRATGYDVSIHGTGHFSFSDLALALPLLQHAAPGSDAGDYGLGPLEGARTLAVTRAWLHAFFDTHLKERPAPLLEGPSPEYPEVSLSVYQP
jgi:predicted dienelactone hydrolase